MRRSVVTIASRPGTRSAMRASMPPTVSRRNGLSSPEGSIGPHASTRGFTASLPVWKMEAHAGRPHPEPDGVSGRAPRVPVHGGRRDPAHRVGAPGAPRRRLRRMPRRAGSAPRAGRRARPRPAEACPALGAGGDHGARPGGGRHPLAHPRALQRHARRSVLAAITALVVIGGATLYVHQYGLPEISRPESFRFSTLWPSAAPEPAAPSPSPAPPASSVAKPLPAPAVSTQPTDLPTATGRAPRSVPTAAPTPAPGPGPGTEPPPSVQPPPVVKPAPPPEPKPEVVAKPAPPPAAPAPPPAPVSPPPAVKLARAPGTGGA